MIRALLITAISAAMAYVACDAAYPLTRQPGTTDNQPRSTTTMTQTRTVYRLMIQDVSLGNLLDEPKGPDCAAPELAKAAELRLREGEEQLVLAQVDQRKGGDGFWHDTTVTVVEVL